MQHLKYNKTEVDGALKNSIQPYASYVGVLRALISPSLMKNITFSGLTKKRKSVEGIIRFDKLGICQILLGE